MRSLFAFAVLGGMAFAANAPVREIHSDFPEDKLAFFRGGRLFELGPMVRAYAPDGTRDFDAPILTPEGQLAPVRDIAVDHEDRSFAVATMKGIALLDARGIQTSFFATKGFLPWNIAITEDHSIWVLGNSFEKEKRHEDRDVVRKYSRDGSLIGSYIRRSTFPTDRKPRIGFEPTQLLASGNEVVLRADGDLIRLDADGHVLGRIRLDDLPMQYFRGFAFTSDRRVYGCGDRGGYRDSLVLFDLPAGTWKETASPAHCLFGLLGSDEATLVFEKNEKDKNDPMITLDWFQQPRN